MFTRGGVVFFTVCPRCEHPHITLLDKHIIEDIDVRYYVCSACQTQWTEVQSPDSVVSRRVAQVDSTPLYSG